MLLLLGPGCDTSFVRSSRHQVLRPAPVKPLTVSSTGLHSAGLSLVPTGHRQASDLATSCISRWGDTDGRDDDTDPMEDESSAEFDRDTLKLASRLLTARAVQRMLLQFQETDVRLFTWLSDFCSKNPPMEGDLFLQKLLKAQPGTITDGITKQDREVSPSDLADRLIIVRHGMAKVLMEKIPKYVANSNLEVYRKHVESGIVQDKPKYRGR